MAKNHDHPIADCDQPHNLQLSERAPALREMLQDKSAVLIRWPIIVLALLLLAVVLIGFSITIQQKIPVKGKLIPVNQLLAAKKERNLKVTTVIYSVMLIRIRMDTNTLRLLMVGQQLFIDVRLSNNKPISGIIVGIKLNKVDTASDAIISFRPDAQNSTSLLNVESEFSGFILVNKISLIELLAKKFRSNR